MSLTLLRHAPLSEQYHGRYIGHTDLSIDFELFVPIILPHTYDVIYSSDLCRCTQSLEALGYSNFKTDERLREVAFKKHFDGKSFEEIAQMESYDPRFLESQERWHTFICEETIEDFRRRIQSFLEELSPKQNILVCSHGGTIREILSLLNNNPKQLDYLEYTIVTIE